MAIHNLALEWQTRGEKFQILSSFQGLLHEYRAKTEREVSRTQSFTQPRWRLSGGEVVKFRSSNWTKSMKIPFIALTFFVISLSFPTINDLLIH